MKLMKIVVLGLLAILSMSPLVAGSPARPATAVDELDPEDEALTPLEAVQSARGLVKLIPKEGRRYVSVGLDMAEFGLTAEKNFLLAKQKMALSLQALGAAQISIKELTDKLKSPATTPAEKDALMLAILDQIVAPLDTFTDFMKVAGSDIFAKFLILIQRIHPEVARTMTFSNGKTMGALITEDVTFMRNLALLLKQLLPKLKTSLQSKGVAVAPVVVTPVQEEANPFGDLD